MMFRRAGLVVLVIVSSFFIFHSAFPESPPPLRVLIFSGLNNHDWKTTTPALQKMFKECSRFGTVDVTEDPGKCDAATFAKYDVVVCNWTPYPETKRMWPEATEKAFTDFIKKGGGFVVFHAAACSFHEWPEFQQLIALTWKEGQTSHAQYHAFKVAVEDKGHPITRGLTDFYTTDELYQKMVPLAPQPLHVLCKAFSAKEKNGTGKDEPMLVVTQLEKGRGANLMLGHDAAAMQNPGFQTLMLRSAEWAATGNVTIPAPSNWPSNPPEGKK